MDTQWMNVVWTLLCRKFYRLLHFISRFLGLGSSTWDLFRFLWDSCLSPRFRITTLGIRFSSLSRSWSTASSVSGVAGVRPRVANLTITLVIITLDHPPPHLLPPPATATISRSKRSRSFLMNKNARARSRTVSVSVDVSA